MYMAMCEDMYLPNRRSIDRSIQPAEWMSRITNTTPSENSR